MAHTSALYIVNCGTTVVRKAICRNPQALIAATAILCGGSRISNPPDHDTPTQQIATSEIALIATLTAQYRGDQATQIPASNATHKTEGHTKRCSAPLILRAPAVLSEAALLPILGLFPARGHS